MNRATRDFLTLVGICAILGAYAIWGFIAYVAIPFAGVAGDVFGRLGAARLLPAILLAALLAVAAAMGGSRLCDRVFASRRLSRQIAGSMLPLPARLKEAAEEAGLGGRVALVESATPFSFVYGFLVPRVAISRAFLEALADVELQAALLHESSHVRQLDPFRALTAEVLGRAFFLLPSLQVLRVRYEIDRELVADWRAEQVCGSRPLLGALLKVLEGQAGESVSAALSGPGHLEARIQRLETGRMPEPAAIGGSSLLRSAFGVGTFLCVFISAVLGLGGSSALVKAAAYELSASGLSLDALCIAPIAAAALTYRGLALRACRAPSPTGQGW